MPPLRYLFLYKVSCVGENHGKNSGMLCTLCRSHRHWQVIPAISEAVWLTKRTFHKFSQVFLPVSYFRSYSYFFWVSRRFSGQIYFLERTSFFKSLLPFLTSVNYEGICLDLVERFLHNLCPCFDIAFVQIQVITRTWNKFV